MSNMQNQIISIKNYGHIHITLKGIMDDRGITRNALARAINARFKVVDKWNHDHVEKIDADVLARICFALDCAPEDIIKYDE